MTMKCTNNNNNNDDGGQNNNTVINKYELIIHIIRVPQLIGGGVY